MKMTSDPISTGNPSGLKLNRLLESGDSQLFFQELDRLRTEAPSMLLVRDQNGQTPLHGAAYCKNERVLHRLISTPTWERLSTETRQVWLEPDHFGRTPLWRTVEAGLISVLPRLFELSFHGEDHRDKVFQRGLCHLAAENPDPEILEWLLSQASPETWITLDIHGHSPLHRACHRGSSRCVTSLLSVLKNDRQTGVALAADGQGQNPLHLACLSGDCDTLRALLDHPVLQNQDLWTQDACGHNPLHLAVISEESSLLNVLVERAPKLEELIVGNLVNATPIHIAAKSPRPELVELLLRSPIIRQGHHLLALDLRGRSPLDIAAQSGKPDNLRQLLAALPEGQVGASPRLLTHCAVGQNRDCLQILLKSPLREGILKQLFNLDVGNQLSPLQSLTSEQLHTLLDDSHLPADIRFIIQSRLSLREGNLSRLETTWSQALQSQIGQALIPLILNDRTLTDFLRAGFEEQLALFLEANVDTLGPRQKEGIVDYLDDDAVTEVIQSWTAHDHLRLSNLPVSVDSSFAIEAYRLLQRLRALQTEKRKGAESTIKTIIQKIPLSSLAAMAQQSKTKHVIQSLLGAMPAKQKRICNLSLLLSEPSPTPSPKLALRNDPPESYFLCPERRLPQMWEVALREKGLHLNPAHWDLWFPCEHHGVDRQLTHLIPTCKDPILFAISGADCFHRKELLFPLLEKAYSWNQACQLMPASYALKDPEDRARFSANFSTDKTYILKKNQHGKQGILLSKSLEEILSASKEGFVIAQEFLTDTFRFQEHQIITRRYLAVHTLKGKVQAYLHPLGLSNVSSLPYQEGSLDLTHQTTTSHQPNELFRRLPGLLSMLKEHLIHQNYNFLELEAKTQQLLASLMKACQAELGRLEQVEELDCYELFGVDLIWLRQEEIGTCPLHPMLIEVNRGPDLTPKESRPYVYAKVARDFLSLSIGETNEFNLLKDTLAWVER